VPCAGQGIELFQSTLPSRGATRLTPCTLPDQAVSIHAPLARSDRGGHSGRLASRRFNPRSPREERRQRGQWRSESHAVSIHAPLARSDAACASHRRSLQGVSIHAPLARSDGAACPLSSSRNGFNPRSPREERLLPQAALIERQMFQSTLPSRGATIAGTRNNSERHSFNPRSPREERLKKEADRLKAWWFQSTLPSRGATRCRIRHRCGTGVSIHAPLARSDGIDWILSEGKICFNPRSPREERLVPERGNRQSERVSIHAPLARSDYASSTG